MDNKCYVTKLKELIKNVQFILILVSMSVLLVLIDTNISICLEILLLLVLFICLLKNKREIDKLDSDISQNNIIPIQNTEIKLADKSLNLSADELNSDE